MFYLHHKRDKQDTIPHANFEEPVYHKITRNTGRSVTKIRQNREMDYTSQNRENDLNEQGDREKDVKTGRVGRYAVIYLIFYVVEFLKNKIELCKIITKALQINALLSKSVLFSRLCTRQVRTFLALILALLNVFYIRLLIFLFLEQQ